MSNQTGTLYVVATPIGNLEDISRRAARILEQADLILAEDTRHSRKLLTHLGIRTRVKSCHAYNERRVVREMLDRLLRGENLAMITDAGTPVISDPGYLAVRAARDQGISVLPVPGPCALTAALSVAGLPADRFLFCGFAPDKPAARRTLLASLVDEPGTLVFYEAPHRILEFLEDAGSVFGPGRRAALGRELTKKYESVYQDSLENLLLRLREDPRRQQGEFVVLIQGAGRDKAAEPDAADRILEILLRHELPISTAVAIATEITAGKKNQVYRQALALAAGVPEGSEDSSEDK